MGFLNPLLYSEPQKLTSPVTSGNNDLTGTNGNQYVASPSGGYSMATGLGYLGGADLSTGLLCGPANASGAGSGTSGGSTPPGGTSPSTPKPEPPAVACSKPVNQVVQGKPRALAVTENSNRCAGYWVVTQSGDVAAFGSATSYGSLKGVHLASPIVAIVATPDRRGYWLLGADGGVFAFGDAALLRLGRGQAPERPRSGHGCHSRRPWLLDRREGRRHIRLR